MNNSYIDQYKPTLSSLLEGYVIDDELPKEEYAFKAYKLLLTAKRNSEALFLVIGKLLKEIRDKELYKVLDYESFNSFLNSEEIGYSRESAYLFIRSYEYLVEHLGLNPDAIGKMNISRINQMIPVLKKVEEEEGRDAAISKLESLDSLRTSDFVKAMQEERKATKPSVTYSHELKKWQVYYIEELTDLHPRTLV